MLYYRDNEYNKIYDLLENSYRMYKSRVAFKSYVKQWTYSDAFNDVIKIAQYLLAVNQKYISYDINDIYYFSVAFFSTIIADKIAVLDIEIVNNNASDALCLNEDNVKNLLKESISLNVYEDKTDVNKPCIIVKSSGTTAFSKGVMLSQKNIMTELVTLLNCKSFPEGSIYYHTLPFSHLFGLLGELIIPFCTGSTVCFSAEKFDFFKDIVEFKPTFMCIPPAIIEAIVKMLQITNDFSKSTGGRLKTIITGGAFFNEDMRSALAKFNVSVYVAYGLTECSPVISIERDNMCLSGSVGQIIPCCDVKIVDNEITVSGDTVMKGYWNDIEATNEVIKDGYLYTGDLGYIDDNGFLFLIGRKSNIIVLNNGEKIVPEIIEKQLNALPEIEESLVVGSNIANRIKLRIYVYSCSSNDTQVLTKQIKEITNKYFSSGFIQAIIYEKAPLKKNNIGKIIRNIY